MPNNLVEMLTERSIEDILEGDRLLQNSVVLDELTQCYHANLSKAGAEQLLETFNDKNASGGFLLRNSEESCQHIILSVKGSDEILHYPIQINTNGTFTINSEIFMSVNDLLVHYQSRENSLGVALTSRVKNSCLPPELSRVGINSILHRIVQSGTDDMLRMVLTSPKCPVLSIKNEEGNTPMHIAAYMNRDGMVDMMMEHKANPSIVNSYGWDTLHLAALGNNPSTVHLLVVKWSVDIESTNPLNMYTALHCSAACSNIETTKMLCLLGANQQAKNDLGLVPVDIANKFANDQPLGIESILEVEQRQCDSVPGSKQEWFVADYPMHEQLRFEQLLTPVNGRFFVRGSYSRLDAYTLCVCWNGMWMHLAIDRTPTGKYLLSGDSQIYDSLEDVVASVCDNCLIRLHPVSADRIRSRLRMDPVDSKILLKQAKSLEEISISRMTRGNKLSLSSFSLFQPRSLEIKRTTPNGYSRIQTRIPISRDRNGSTFDIRGTLQGSINSLRSKARSIPTISASQIRIGSLLGEGNYGKVYSGSFVDRKFFTHAVAVKILKDALEGTLRKEFIDEASVMRKLTHPFIVRLYGVVANKRDLWMIQELIPLGSLDTYLQMHRNADLTSHIRLWTIQFAEAMKYMEAKRYVHRDLAARNLLLSSVERIKIADFGLARYTGNNSSNLYVQTSTQAIPIAWYAPEAYTHYTFTNKSDVWSFGVTIWEMYSGGERPYSQINAHPSVLLHYILANYRLSKPERCSSSTWTLIYACWNINADYRPSFAEILRTLSSLSEYRSSVCQIEKISRVFE